jgi:hypothetical protein
MSGLRDSGDSEARLGGAGSDSGGGNSDCRGWRYLGGSGWQVAAAMDLPSSLS